ncbi:MAG: 23S rRNA (uracil1939-C5)-methyltransferase [Cellvibrionaceae bacterium]|jgi:23S rRNA (uracil1939-C5)-methyltransferase
MARFYKPKKQVQASLPRTLTNIKVERLSDDGRGIAKINTATEFSSASASGQKRASSKSSKGKTVFIDGALPEETVNATVFQHSNRYSEAYVTEIIKPSKQRVQAKCKHYTRCGGCHVQHMSIEEQHRFKLGAILDQLKNWAQIEPEIVIPTLSSEQYRYRRRVRLGVDSRKSDGNKPLMGFRQNNSKQLIRVTECPVMVESLESLIEPLQMWLNTYVLSITHIELIDTDKTVGVVIRYARSLSLDLRQQLQTILDPFDAICWFQNEKNGDLESVEGVRVKPELRYGLSDSLHSQLLSVQPVSARRLTLNFHPQDFIQGNANVNQLMVTQAIELMKPQAEENILDLFCGVGNFSLPLSRLAKQVRGVEGVENMVVTATDNAKRNHCDNTQFFKVDLSDWKAIVSSGMLSSSCDALILDPPRSGAKTLCEKINKLMPKRIVYVSCDSATFARDAQLLCGHSYILSHLGLVDMFPQTSHSEVMGLFVHPSWKEVQDRL